MERLTACVLVQPLLSHTTRTTQLDSSTSHSCTERDEQPGYYGSTTLVAFQLLEELWAYPDPKERLLDHELHLYDVARGRKGIGHNKRG